VHVSTLVWVCECPLPLLPLFLILHIAHQEPRRRPLEFGLGFSIAGAADWGRAELLGVSASRAAMVAVRPTPCSRPPVRGWVNSCVGSPPRAAAAARARQFGL